MYAREFERIGKRLFAEHLVGGNFGNISVRKGDGGFFVTRTGDYLDVLPEPLFVPLDGPVPEHASSEFRVHREIYRNTRTGQLSMPIRPRRSQPRSSWTRSSPRTARG